MGEILVAAVWTHTHLIEVDFSGIEAVLVGAFARDPLVYRMAKLGLHAYVASHLPGGRTGGNSPLFSVLRRHSLSS